MIRGGNAWELAIKEGFKKEQIDKLREKRDELYQYFLQTKDITIKNVVTTLEQLSKNIKWELLQLLEELTLN